MLRAYLLIICLLAPLGVSAQNLFDDGGVESGTDAPKTPAKEKVSPKSATDAKPGKIATKHKKRKKSRRKKSTAATTKPATAAGYTEVEIAKNTFVWAPDAEPLRLASSAQGMKNIAQLTGIKSPGNSNLPLNAIEIQPKNNGFKLPQIPIAQVLIVAGFVILFLIYRFRVDKQIKRKKY
jgi:hypothetical protein